MHNFPAPSLALFVALALQGCSSDPLEPTERKEPTEPEIQPVPLDAYPDLLAAALCGVTEACCGQRGVRLDIDACLAELGGDYASDVELITALAVSFDPDAAGRCIAAFATQIGSCRLIGDELARPPCDAVFVGRLEPGAACAEDIECAPIAGQRSFCDTGPGADVATCVPAIPEGDTCFGSTCADGLYCNLFAVRCEPKKSSGVCELITACADDAACSPAGMCEPRLDDGSPCQLDLQCEGGTCDVTGVCARTLQSDAVCLAP